MESTSSTSDNDPDLNIDQFTRNSLLDCITREMATPTSRLAFDFLTNEIISSKKLIMAATTAAVEKPVYSIEEPKKRKSYSDIMFGLDDEFNTSFRLSRTTVRSLVNDLKTMPEYRQEDDSSVGKSVCLLSYFLGNKDVQLDDIKEMFNMKDTELVKEELVRVSKALQDVSGRVRLRWPLENESLEIGERFIRKYRFPDVMGIMGFWVFGTFKEGILVQVVVDDLHMYLDINATEINDGRPTPAEFYFRTATYSYITNFLPEDFNVLATSAYPDRIPNIVTPFNNKNDNLSDKEKSFNMLMKNCLALLKETMKLQIQRFPRLLNIGLTPLEAKHIILGSCVLHNASIFYHDLAPF